tara:strand:- start:218 stop:451 length:234 start_codon:yes stop_codon:yes gene_type:complete
MIIPVKCFTCGKVLADKYLFYLNEVKKMKQASGMDKNEVIYLTENNVKKTPEGVVMDMLQLDRICCRRHMLTHVDIE